MEDILAKDILDIATTVIGIFGGFAAIFIFLLFLPLFIRIMLRLLMGIIYSQFRVDISPILDLMLFPGAMLRSTFVWLFMTMMGYDIRILYAMPNPGENNNVTSFKPRGFSIFGSPNGRLQHKKHVSQLKLVVAGALMSYMVLPFAILMVIYSNQVILTMWLFLPSGKVMGLYYYILFTLFLGGIPVPAETLSVINIVQMKYPQLILSLFINIIATLIMTPYIGSGIAITLFVIVEVIVIFTVYMAIEDPDKDDLYLRINDILATI